MQWFLHNSAYCLLLTAYYLLIKNKLLRGKKWHSSTSAV
jgi:hypothetical protein